MPETISTSEQLASSWATTKTVSWQERKYLLDLQVGSCAKWEVC